MIALLLTLFAGTPRDTVGVMLRASLDSSQHPGMRWSNIRDVREPIRSAYEAHDWRPLWSASAQATLSARRVVSEIDSAATRGLNPADYDAAWLDAALDSLPQFSPAKIVRYELTLSVAAARYLLAVSRGRIDPRALHPQLALERDTVDTSAMLLGISESDRPDTLLRSLEPHDRQYHILMGRLADLRQFVSVARPGVERDSTTRRIRQLAVTLERRRWLPRRRDRALVVVNVPAFQLYAMTGAVTPTEEVARMNVVVGRAVGHPTPMLTTSIVAVDFHPVWIVPPSIAEREIRPDALRDSSFLQRNHYELLRRDSIVPSTPDNAARIGHGIDVRQTAGPWNALGKVKFVAPNIASIYFHDTPEQALFDHRRRDFSHGCVRVADPQMLANFVLGGEADWPASRIAEMLAGDSTTSVRLRHPVPVVILYQTLVATELGGVIAYADIYGEDRRLDVALRRGYPYPVAPTGH